MRRTPFFGLAASLIVLAFACGPLGSNKGQDDEHPFPDSATRSGCLQGVMVHAQTGERLPIKTETKDDGIFAIVHGSLIKASPVSSKEHLKGEFTLCGVPVDEIYPLTVRYAGYADFETVFDIPSTVPARTGTGEMDVRARRPTRVANIKLYPLSAISSDYTLGVVHNGSPVVGAVVTIKPTGAGIGIAGPYLSPFGAGRNKPLTATTNDQGLAVFPKDQLIWGSNYTYVVIPPNNADLRAARGNVFVGMGLDGSGIDPFRETIVLETAQTTLAVVSTSAGLNDYVPDGTISYTFNRDVELVPASADGITASLSNAVSAALKANDPGNEKTEQVTVTLTGRTLKLAPVWTKQPDKAKEPAVSITYTGIQVRPATGARRLQTLALAPTVVLFGGAVSSVATTFKSVGETSMVGSAGDTLGPITVELRDQNDARIQGATVTFAVTAGDGSVNEESVETNAQGQASTYWTLGATGAQELVASVGGLEVTFTATIGTLTVTSGNAQRALVSTSLLDPIVLTVTDENSDPAPNVGVILVANNADDELTVDGDSGTTAFAVTDANGEISIDWELSTTMGAHSVTVRSGGVNLATLTATAQQPTTLVKVSGDSPVQSANNGVALMAPIVAQLNDQNGILIEGAELQFATANTDSTLEIGGNGAAATVTGDTDAAGQVSAVWTMGSVDGAHTAMVTVVGFAGVTGITFNATAL
jgi:hypothetical protein